MLTAMKQKWILKLEMNLTEIDYNLLIVFVTNLERNNLDRYKSTQTRNDTI